MIVSKPSDRTRSGRWNEADQKTIRGIVFPTNGHDQLATCKKLRVLTVVDTFSRYVPVLDVRYSYRGEDVVATLDRVFRTVGYPKTIRVDQGSEFVSRTRTFGLTSAGWCLTSPGPESPPTTPSSRHSTAGSELNALTRTGS